MFRGFRVIMKVEFTTARNIVDLVNKKFPYESPYMAHRKELSKAFVDKTKLTEYWNKQKKLLEKDRALDKVRTSYNYLKQSAFEYFKELIKAVHKYKVQNCGESARITYAVARINQIKNESLNPALLIESETKDYSKSLFPEVDKMFDEMRELEIGYTGKRIDHIATQLTLDNGTKIIMDSGLGECGEISQMEKVYFENYNDVFSLNKDKELKIIEGEFFEEFIPTLNDKDASKLAKCFPELDLSYNSSENNKKLYLFLSLLERFKK